MRCLLVVKGSSKQASTVLFVPNAAACTHELGREIGGKRHRFQVISNEQYDTARTHRRILIAGDDPLVRFLVDNGWKEEQL